ncbi:MFS transporter [Aurantiacibacter suaedae]|uniref:MFS transporter n=1 Tax=Aurantiacibacter suaedae TaxID=2545755 RepID=UPI0010F8C88D|nr:MFS transporter [Aurantiacibacter suaedae]
MARSFTEALDAQPVRPFQWMIAGVCMLVLVCDGIDLQLLGIVAPLVIESFGTDPSTFGIAAGAALVGFGLGSFAGGVLGDAIGRRWTLAIAALVFSLSTVGAASSGDVTQMALWRLAGGLGFGGAYANALALAGEWLPERWRGVTVSTLSVGTPIGGTIVGLIGPGMAATYGWDGTFLRIGLATTLLVVVIVVALRDSPAFLLALGKREQAQKNARFVLDTDEELAPERHEADGVEGQRTSVFDKRNLRLNIGIGVAFTAAAMVAYSILTWTTTMLTARGFTLADAGGAVALAGITSMVGSVLVGLAMRRFGSHRVLLTISIVLTCVLVALAIQVEALPATPNALEQQVVTWLVGAAGGFFSAAIAGMYVLMTFGYPQSCRSSGIGFGIFMSRIGAIGGSALGGALLELGGASTWPFFAILVVCAIVISGASLVIDRHVPPLVRE